ncbi:MAG: tetratricopeptide repeat protein [Proteobacteria bacterium]|nr:tetratricopeptide repeat protein [Pseudomonadota bacterium]
MNHPLPSDNQSAELAAELFAKAMRAHEAGDIDAACPLYEYVLLLAPAHADAMGNLGVALKRLGRIPIAIGWLERAAKIAPQQYLHLYNLGNAFSELRQFEAAVGAYSRALEINPNYAMAHHNSGISWEGLANVDAAIVSYRRAIAADPTSYDACLNLGVCLETKGFLKGAANAYQTAVSFSPNRTPAYNNLALVLQKIGQPAEAVRIGQIALTIDPGNHLVASNILLYLQYHPQVSDSELLRISRTFGDRFPPPTDLQRAVSSGRRLRVGYVSADFSEHPVGHFLRNVLPHHDLQQYEVYCYANNHYRDAITRELASASRWRDITDLDDDAVLRVISEDGIDILVDLSGHTAGNRLPVFARRAAPLQVSWLGYFATTGVAAMDAVLMDAHHVPAGYGRLFSERVVRLPSSRFCYSAPDVSPEVAQPPIFKNGHVTFGSFNNTAKLNGQVMRVWAEILNGLPTSRLILKCRTLADQAYRNELLMNFSQLGIEAKRIELRLHSPHEQLLAEYGDVDVAFDPFPFTGGLTSCEALWMGVPVITLYGSRPVSRQTLCFLRNLGLEDLAADNVATYVKKAIALAGNLEMLASLRLGLRDRMRNSPLMDGPGFTLGLERALTALWVSKQT